MTDHQQKQIEAIDRIESQVADNNFQPSTVIPALDSDNDPRISLTGVHIPVVFLKQKIEDEIIKPLKKVSPDVYFFPQDSLHLTIKNIRVINDPPHFTSSDIEKVKQIFSEVIPKHKKFKVYFYRLMLFPNNLSLIGTTDPELDQIVLDLDKRLKEAGIPDDKQYINSRYFFSNITLARFADYSKEFAEKVAKLSVQINFEPYVVDSVSVVTCNAIFKKLKFELQGLALRSH